MLQRSFSYLFHLGSAIRYFLYKFHNQQASPLNHFLQYIFQSLSTLRRWYEVLPSQINILDDNFQLHTFWVRLQIKKNYGLSLPSHFNIQALIKVSNPYTKLINKFNVSVRNLVVSDLRSKTKVSRFESSYYLCVNVRSLQ